MTIEGSPEHGGALRALVDAARAAAGATSVGEALSALAHSAAEGTGAALAVVRIVEDGALVARAVRSSSASTSAAIEGSRLPLSSLAEPAAGSLWVAVRAGENIVGALELRPGAVPFDGQTLLVADAVAAEVALVLRAFERAADGRNGEDVRDRALLLAAEALVAAADADGTPAQIARSAAVAANAEAALIWTADGRLAASIGTVSGDEAPLAQAALRILGSGEFVHVESVDGGTLASARLGEPAVGVLQLVLADGVPLEGLRTFALRAAQALRVGERAHAAALELERSRALLEVIGRATSPLSLAHTLATAVDQLAEILGVDRVAIYLREDDRLVPAAGRALAGPHTPVAEVLLDLLQGPYRGRGIVVVDDLAREPRLAEAANAAAEAGIESAVALALTVGEDTIGLLALYPPPGRETSEDEQSLLVALGAQMAIAVQNARLHERAQRLANEREQLLAAERESAREIRALYDVSREFTRSLSLDSTLEQLAKSAVDLLGVDAAVIRMPDPRGDLLVVRAVHVRDAHVDAAARALLGRPQPLAALPLRRLFRRRRPLRIDASVATQLGGSHELLIPFLKRGSTAAVVPIATPGEVVATLTLVSFDPGRTLTNEMLENATSIAAQAALAIDNGRLYQQQKAFADTIQRALLPRAAPALRGLEIGEVYESSARVDVGGDVYDFLELDDGRLAVVLGDVTGHGIEATADMAMAKFVFRSLAREHPEPADFLAAANEVVIGEIAVGKFITMTYMTIAPSDGTVVAASAGHPAPLVVTADGAVEAVDARGLALGIEGAQHYEEARATLAPGASAVVFTDGVVEARRDDELYGQERLIATLAEHATLPPEALARAVVDSCRAFAGGELADDCAVVVIRRTG